MALYRCAACGSPNVVTDTQAGDVEYNYLKGAVGTVVLGAGGAAAGIGSKQQRVFKCPDCGISLTYTMPEEIKNVIDLGVISADARDNLTLWKVPVTWDFLKGKYKHIEEGAGDAVLEMRAEKKAEIAKIQSEINRDVANRVIKRMQDIDAELAIDENCTDNTDELQQLWTKDSAANISAREKAYQEGLLELNTVFHEKIAALETETHKMENIRAEKETALEKEQSELSEKLPTLGVFKLGEKQKGKKRLEEISTLLSALAEEKEKNIKDREKKINDIQQEKVKEVERLKEKTTRDYPLTESPYERKERLNQIREARASLQRKDEEYERLHEKISQGYALTLSPSERKDLLNQYRAAKAPLTETQKTNEEIKDILLLIMKEYDRRMYFSSVSEDSDTNSVIEICSMVSDKYQNITGQRLSALVRQLKEEGKIIETTEKSRRYYHLA